MNFDGDKITRCPLRPFKDEPQQYSEWFQLYSFREKGIVAENGAFWDQPNVYIEIMATMESAIADTMNPDFKREIHKEDDLKVGQLRDLGIPIMEKR